MTPWNEIHSKTGKGYKFWNKLNLQKIQIDIKLKLWNKHEAKYGVRYST